MNGFSEEREREISREETKQRGFLLFAFTRSYATRHCPLSFFPSWSKSHMEISSSSRPFFSVLLCNSKARIAYEARERVQCLRLRGKCGRKRRTTKLEGEETRNGKEKKKEGRGKKKREGKWKLRKKKKASIFLSHLFCIFFLSSHVINLSLSLSLAKLPPEPIFKTQSKTSTRHNSKSSRAP